MRTSAVLLAPVELIRASTHGAHKKLAILHASAPIFFFPVFRSFFFFFCSFLSPRFVGFPSVSQRCWGGGYSSVFDDVAHIFSCRT